MSVFRYIHTDDYMALYNDDDLIYSESSIDPLRAMEYAIMYLPDSLELWRVPVAEEEYFSYEIGSFPYHFSDLDEFLKEFVMYLTGDDI